MGFDLIKTRLIGTLKGSIPEQASLPEFIENKVIGEKTGKRGQTAGGEFGKAVRKVFVPHNVDLDINISTLKTKGGWSDLEAKYLHDAFIDLSKKHSSAKTVKFDVAAGKIYITGQYKGRKAFAVQGYLFKEAAKIAYKNISKKYENIANLSRAEYINIQKQLISAGTNDEPLRLIYDELATKGSIESLAKTRLGLYSEQIEDERGNLRNLNVEVHAGHLEGLENFRLSATARAAVGALSLGFENENDPRLQQYIDRVSATIKIDKDVTHGIFKEIYGNASVTGWSGTKITQHTTMELGFLNVSKAEEKKLTAQLGKILLEEFNNWADAVDTAQDIIDSGNSPSIAMIVENYIIGAITGGQIQKLKNIQKKRKKRYKPIKGTYINENKVPKNTARVKKRLEISRRLREVARRKEKEVLIDLFSVRNLINEVLAIRVEEQMGDSTDAPTKLRYQTGRFADSAKLLTLTREQAGTLFGTYTYQRNPYDVFLPGGRLGTAQRDPRIYVESAIQEAAMSILRRKFPGLQLELQ
jgi:hypothetical protein